LSNLFTASNDQLVPGRAFKDVPQAPVEIGDIVADVELVQEGQITIGSPILYDGVDADDLGLLDRGHQVV
jgi:hypothetical protein